MAEHELGKILKTMCDTAPQGYKVANIHLFGVKYASTILKNNLNINDIVNAAGLNKSYATEVSKGVKLSKYVIPKE